MNIKNLIANFFRRLTNDDHEQIADQIVELFPKEKKAVYYVPPIKKRNSIDNKSELSKGKLVDRYRNTITFLRTAGIVDNLRKRSRSEESEPGSVSKYQKIKL